MPREGHDTQMLWIILKIITRKCILVHKILYKYNIYHLLFIIQVPLVYLGSQITEFLSRHAEAGANLDVIDEIE